MASQRTLTPLLKSTPPTQAPPLIPVIHPVLFTVNPQLGLMFMGHLGSLNSQLSLIFLMRCLLVRIISGRDEVLNRVKTRQDKLRPRLPKLISRRLFSRSSMLIRWIASGDLCVRLISCRDVILGLEWVTTC